MLFKCVKCIENVVASLHWVLVSFDRGDLSWRRSGFLAKGELGVHDESRQGSLWEINQQPLEILQHKLSSIFHPAWRNILMDAFPVSSADLAFLVSWFYHLIPM